MDNNILLSIASIGVLGIACQWFAWWVRIPSILFLLTVGIIVGPVLNLINPDALFGNLLFPFISLSVAVILFEGSLTLKFEDIRGHGKTVSNLVSTGALITWLIIAYSTYHLLNLPIELAFLFGAIVVVTGPTVIIPMLRTVRPNTKVANVLRWEGIVIDALGALLAVLVFDFIISGQQNNALGMIFLTFGKIILMSIKLISCVISCYNEEENIPVLLNQIKKNNLEKNFEFIIVNNGSTDNSWKIICEKKVVFPK